MMMMTTEQKEAIKKMRELEREYDAFRRECAKKQNALIDELRKPYAHLLYKVVEVTYITPDKVEHKELAIWGGYDSSNIRDIHPWFYKVGRGGKIASCRHTHLEHLERLEENGGKLLSMELYVKPKK